MPANRNPEAWATQSAQNATTAPAAAGTMLYHSTPIQVSTWPTSFHQLYSMMKLAAVDAAQEMIPNKNIRTISLAICEGRIKGDFYSSSNGADNRHPQHSRVTFRPGPIVGTPGIRGVRLFDAQKGLRGVRVLLE